VKLVLKVQAVVSEDSTIPAVVSGGSIINGISPELIAGEERAAVVEPLRSDSPLQQADTRMDVQAVLGILSPEHRQVIVLREFEGMSYKEISAAVNIPCGTVESRLFRAREHLKKLFGGYE